jgi:outer membrane protein assembly factor BamA
MKQLLFFFLYIFAFITIPCAKGNAANPPDSISSVDYFIIRNIEFSGNKITKERIIQRELLFKENDTIPKNEISTVFEQSRLNLVNTSLFNIVHIDSVPVKNNPKLLDVKLDFTERWYIWPVPILEFADRNINEWLKKKDWRRVNYGMFLTWNNFRGRREKLILFTRFGYDQKYELSYQIPYINKKQTWGVGAAGGFAQNHEIAYNSVNNKEVYYREENESPKQEVFAYTEAYHRKGIHDMHWFKFQYTDLNVTDSVFIYNPDYSFSPFNNNKFFSLFYQYRSDYRDFKQYPLKGHYFDAMIEKKGLGFMAGQEVNILDLKANYRQYNQISDRFFWASGLSAKVSPIGSTQPYYYQQGLGYGRDFVRGYEFYVIDGQHYALMKNNLKFELVSMREFSLDFIPSDKFSKLYYAFYLNVFADFGYVIDHRNISTNPLANDIMAGYGIGLDFATYYDFVFRFEYTFNKMGESGFFISFMPSI